jgi:hypothetical protein
MGDEYTNIVHTCLTCLDPDNIDFGDDQEFQDKNGIYVGVRYLEEAGFVTDSREMLANQC